MVKMALNVNVLMSGLVQSVTRNYKPPVCLILVKTMDFVLI